VNAPKKRKAVKSPGIFTEKKDNPEGKSMKRIREYSQRDPPSQRVEHLSQSQKVHAGCPKGKLGGGGGDKDPEAGHRYRARLDKRMKR